jgi:hypothetical protein
MGWKYIVTEQSGYGIETENGHILTLGVAQDQPLNVLSRSPGSGVLEVQWSPPAVDEVAYYRVFVCAIVDGTYVQATPKVYGTWARLPNLPVGTRVYTKVRAYDAADLAGELSEPARNARAGKAVTTLLVCSLVGDEIAAGTLFTSWVGKRLLAVQTLEPAVVA